ncbi:MAG: hypothetical protein K2N33_01010 [Clostridia bacterium]|nr:hypothetical protein [Clostridia bacterium]
MARNKIFKFYHTFSMAKRRTKKMIEDIFEGTACANECTGLYQKVSLDTDEVEEFHRKFTEDDE